MQAGLLDSGIKFQEEKPFMIALSLLKELFFS
jgi:hypothetical protein